MFSINTVNTLRPCRLNTVNLEIFMRISFSRRVLKDLFVTLKICD